MLVKFCPSTSSHLFSPRVNRRLRLKNHNVPGLLLLSILNSQSYPTEIHPLFGVVLHDVLTGYGAPVYDDAFEPLPGFSGEQFMVDISRTSFTV